MSTRITDKSVYERFLRTDRSAWERFLLICKPPQSGKTFVMIKTINNDLSDDSDESKKIVNFIFCDNSLLLTKQTGERIEKNVDTLPGIEEKYVEFSSRSKKNDNDICMDIMVSHITNVICCTNRARINDLSTIIDSIKKLQPNTYNFKIWIDEADKYGKFIEQDLVPLAEKNDNVYCNLITATPKVLFDKFGYINVLPLEDTTSEHYHGWSDNNIQIREIDQDYDGGATGYASMIMDEVKESNDGKIPPNTKWYIPAKNKIKSHNQMSSMLVGNGFAVFVVNGHGLTLNIPGKDKIVEAKTEELHAQVRRLYKEHNLSQYPVAITGYLCVGRGISIMQPKNDVYDEFIFDYGILSNCSKKAEACQNAGRHNGNCKNWYGYKPPTVYCTSKFNVIVTQQEHLSRELAKIAYDRDKEEPSMITKDDVSEIVKQCTPVKQEREIIVEEFKGVAKEAVKAARVRCKELWPGTRISGPTMRNKDTDESGFYLSTIGKGEGKRRKRTYDEVYETRGWALNDKHPYTFHPCYRDLEDKTSLVWLLSYQKIE